MTADRSSPASSTTEARHGAQEGMLDGVSGREALRLFVEQVPAAVAVLDRAFRYVAVSRRWASDFALAGPPAAGASHFDFFEDPEGAWQALCERCLDEEAAGLEEMWLHRKDGFRYRVRWEVHPWHPGPGAAAGLIVVAHDRTERIQQANDLAIFTERLKQLHRLSTSTYDGLDALLEDYLRTGRDMFGMEVGVISQVDGGRCVFRVADPDTVPGFQAGRSYPFSEMYCQAVLAGGKTMAYADARAPGSGPGQAVEALREHPACVKLHVHAYLGTPVFVNGTPFGVLSFASRKPRAPFDALEREVVELMAEGIGRFIGLDLAETARRRAQLELVKEREFLHAVLNNIQEGTVACDEQGVLTLFNRAARLFHGLPEQPISPDQWAAYYGLHHADGTPMATAEVPLFRAFQGEQVRGVEVRIRPKNGKARTLVASGQPLVDTEGNRLGAVVAMHDITERKRAEEALRASEERYRTLTRTAAVAIVTTDAEGTVIDWNEGAQRVFGYAREDILGRSIEALMPPRYVADHRRGMARVREAGETRVIGHTVELHGRRNNGEEFPLELSLSQWRAGGLSCFTAIIRDISERVEAEARLRESEYQLRRAQEIAHLGYWAWDVQTGALHWSDELYRIYGLTPEAPPVTYEWYIALLHPEDRGLAQGVVEEALRTHEPFNFYHRIIRPDGEERTLHGEGEVLIDDDGNVVKMFGTGHDVTEVKRAEEVLRESEERYRLLAENATDMIVRTARDGVITYASPACRTMLGYGPEEVVGCSAYAFIHPDDHTAVRAVYGEVLEAADILTVQYRLRRKDGGYVWVETTGRSIGGPEAGAAAELITVTRDVTERRRAEERLRLLEASVSASLDGITISGVAEPDNPLIYVSPGFERITGYTAEETLGRNCRFLQNDDRDQPAVAEIRAAIREGRQCRVVLRNYRKDGALFWNELTLYPLHDAGRLTHYVGIQRDVTERKQAEQALARINAKLEQRNRELQDFAYVASHDLQEPLRKIRAFADLMEEDYGGAVDETGRYYLERMQDAATRMSRLISDLLAYSRVTTHTRPFDRVDLDALAADVLSDLEVQISEAEGSVDVGPLPALEADATQMRQLLQNLIANALKFQRPGVRPVVTVRATLEDGTAPGGEESPPVCRLEVRDNGIGFDEKYLDRIFTPFQRLHNRGEYAGTGMGLAICRRIVERHQGTLTARSTPGHGAAFIVTLPLRQPNPQPKDESA